MCHHLYDKCIFIVIACFISLFSCNHHAKDKVVETTEMSTDSLAFSPRQALGTIDKKSLDEISGIAMSIENENSFWVHNDNGGKSKIYLVNNEAKVTASCKLTDVDNRDWEDIATFKDPRSGKSKIALGDIGDNDAEHKTSYIYLINEPKIAAEEEVDIANVDKISYQYEDGKRDAETLMVDPTNGDIILVSKREKAVHVYQIKYPYSFSDINIAKNILTLPYTQMVGGDIVADGTKIILKNYATIWLWTRKKTESIVTALGRKPIELPYVREPQGEAICWARDGKSFYTVSEESPLKVPPVLYRYEIKLVKK